MQSAIQAGVAREAQTSRSHATLWAARIIRTLVVLFLVFDGITKVIRESHVVAATAELGYPESSITWIGVLLLVCTLIYLIPRSATLGAILLTGYLGGAVASQVRIGHPVFQCIFPVIFGVLIWAGIVLRDVRSEHAKSSHSISLQRICENPITHR